MSRVPFKTVAEAWEYFKRRTFAPDIGKQQTSDMRKAFYAGASCVFDLMIDHAGLSEREAVVRMENLHTEFRLLLTN